jgi:hypothetical protein
MTMKRTNPIATLFASLVLAASLVAVSACGSDDTAGGSGNNDDNNGAVNNGQTNNGSTLDLELPAAVDVVIDPARSVFRTGLSVAPGAVVYNGHGERMNGENVRWSHEPAAAVEEADGSRIRLLEQGAVEFRACTLNDGVHGEPVCGSKTLFVDDGPPQVEIITPAPGEWLGEDGAESIVVEGRVTDTHATNLKAFVNGERVDLDDDGGFSTTLPAEFGINHIEAVATDGIHRSAGQALLDVLWAPEYYPMSNTASQTRFGFNDALLLDLGQRFFDDGEAPSQPNETTIVTEDLADIFALLVKHVDFMDQVPDPVIDTDAGQLRITDLTTGEPQVLIELLDGGAELFLWVPDVEMQTRGAIALDETVLDMTGSVTAGLAAFAVLSIDKPGHGQDFTAEITDVELSIQSAESNFASPEADALFELAESALRTKIEDILVDTLSEQFIEALPDILVDALNSVEDQLTALSFELDTGFTDPMELTITGTIGSFSTEYRRSMRATLAADVITDSAPLLDDAPGIPMATEYSNDVSLFETSRAQIAVRLGLLNGLLHGLWQAGFLEIDLTDMMPDDYAGMTDQADLSAKLQPVLSRPKAGEPYDFILRAGQMEVEAELLSQTDVYAVNLEVGILMSLDDNSIAISVPDAPEVTAWVISTTGDRSLLNDEIIEDLILGEVWPQVEETLRQGLAFDLPVPQLDGLSDLAPSLTALELEFMLERPVAYRDGFIIFDSILQGQLPLGQ